MKNRVNTVVQTTASTNYYKGVNCPGSIFRGLRVPHPVEHLKNKEVFGSYIYMESRSIITSSSEKI